MPELYNFQKQAVLALHNKHIIISTTGSGKGAMSVVFARDKVKETGKRKVLVVTTASKAKLTDFQDDADLWCGSSFRTSLSSFSVISWHKLSAWVNSHRSEIDDYVYIFDECLPADTKVATLDGEKEIADIKVGDRVLSYNHETNKKEYRTVTRTIKKSSPKTMIRLLLSDGTAIISTANHPHYTNDGYKKAEDIKIGDMLYEERTVCEAKSRKRESKEIWGAREMCDLRSNHSGENAHETPKGQASSRKSNILLERMWKNCNIGEREANDGEPRAKGKAKKDGGRKARQEQLLQRCSVKGEGNENETCEWMEAYMGGESRLEGWQRKILEHAKTLMGEIERSEQGMGDGAGGIVNLETARLSKQLQIGHRKHLLQNRHRMRREFSQQCKSESKGQEERREIVGVRVESIEILELRNIKQRGLYRDSDNVYCLDVEGNHNFFANGVLTHNCAKSSAGVSSGMGKAFLKITNATSDWAGFTATPGDTWLKFYPYFTACGLVKNKTAFMHEFAQVQTYKGFPEIVGWNNEPKLKAMWASISYAPDTSQMARELPSETHRVVSFSQPKEYKKVMKTRVSRDGELLETSGAFVSELRQMCFTKEKKQWLLDFVENLESGVVIFYNFIKTGDEIEDLLKKTKKRIWRIDGTHHDIPTEDTAGKDDIVVCQWQSGSEALNLQFYHYWVSVEPHYSYSTSIQARGRIKRIGQKSPMSYYYLVTEETIEQDIMKVLKGKGTFSEENWLAGK